MASKKTEVVESQEGYVEISSTVLDQKNTKSKKIKVRPFVTTPAQVKVKLGTWFPTGDMQGAKIDVEITVPCYVEEIKNVYYQTLDLADELLDEEVTRIKEATEKD